MSEKYYVVSEEELTQLKWAHIGLERCCADTQEQAVNNALKINRACRARPVELSEFDGMGKSIWAWEEIKK